MHEIEDADRASIIIFRPKCCFLHKPQTKHSFRSCPLLLETGTGNKLLQQLS